jgi:hypothetical protein
MSIVKMTINVSTMMFMFATTVVLLVIGFVGEVAQLSWIKLKAYELPRLSVDLLLSYFKGYSKPAYY